MEPTSEASISILAHVLPVKQCTHDPAWELVPSASWTGQLALDPASGREKDPIVMPSWGGAGTLVNPRRLGVRDSFALGMLELEYGTCCFFPRTPPQLYPPIFNLGKQ